MSSLPFKDHIQEIHPYKPGKPIAELERELGISGVIKLASNENPLGCSPKAVEAMKQAVEECHLYPDGSGHYLVEKLASMLDVDPDQLILGNGSNEIIELAGRGFLREGDEVISSESSFLVYPILAQAVGAKFVSVPMKDYGYDLQAIAKSITDKTRIIFIANPNNPTGTYASQDEVNAFLDKVPERVLVCLDEAYYDCVDAEDFPESVNYIQQGRKNVLFFRTFSKAYGLAGLRIGYACGHKDVISYLHKIRQPFNTNMIAQAGALAALDDVEFKQSYQSLLKTEKKFYYESCEALGVECIRSQGNFVLMHVKQSGKELAEKLLHEGLIVRSMESYGFEEWVRVTFGTHDQNVKFFDTLKKYL